MTPGEALQLEDSQLLRQCGISHFKGSGKGGQKRNKSSQGVRLQWQGIQVQDCSSRSREENQAHALGKLRLELAVLAGQQGPWPLEPLHPYVVGGQLRINPHNPALPQALASLLAGVREKGVKPLALALGTTPSQLRRFFATHGLSSAWELALAASRPTLEQVLAALQSEANPANAAGKQRFGIQGRLLGVNMPCLRELAKKIGKNREIALELWKTGFNEARILATLVHPPELFTSAQAFAWSLDFNSWDLVDQFCTLGVAAGLAWELMQAWRQAETEFIKRAAFSLMAVAAVHEKQRADAEFLVCLGWIREAAPDERNFVKKSVNWALRQIGKRSPELGQAAYDLALELSQARVASSRWIGKNAAKELQTKWNLHPPSTS